MSSDRLSTLGPATRRLVEQIEAAEPTQRTPEFTRLRENLVSIQVCTSLSDEEATARANLVPSGTVHGWVLTEDPAAAPVACADHPDTHRHLVFEC